MKYELTIYSDGEQEFPAVFMRWDEVERFLGEAHTGDAEQNKKIVQGLLDAGAPEWVQDADSGWVDEEGWGIYHR